MDLRCSGCSVRGDYLQKKSISLVIAPVDALYSPTVLEQVSLDKQASQFADSTSASCHEYGSTSLEQECPRALSSNCPDPRAFCRRLAGCRQQAIAVDFILPRRFVGYDASTCWFECRGLCRLQSRNHISRIFCVPCTCEHPTSGVLS